MSDEPIKPTDEEGNENPAPETATSSVSADTAASSTIPARRRWQNIGLDVFLVLLAAGVAGGSMWYLKHERAKYYVPSPYEVARAENDRLRLERDELQPLAYKAEEQILFQERLEARKRELQEVQRANTAKEAELQEKGRRILAKQHEIRQADKEHRQVAMSLLPGMNLGTVRTKKGSRVYYEARITRVEDRTLVLAHSSGMVRVASSDLVAGSLPPLARYAFGVDDLLHIREMDAANAASSGDASGIEPTSAAEPQNESQRVAARSSRTSRAQTVRRSASFGRLSLTAYDPPSAKPVVDVQLPAKPAEPARPSMEDTSLIATPMNEVMPFWLKNAR